MYARQLLPTGAVSLSCRARPPKRRCLSTDRSVPQPPYHILFFGADKFSCVTLETLYQARKDLLQHVVVVTPPDQKTGRRLREIHRPPLRLLAESLSLPSIALPPTLLNDWEPPSEFHAQSPSSLLVTASFGHLLPTSLLSRFLPLNTLNLHPSLLPEYRGAAPIQWGIMNGDADSNWGRDTTSANRGMGVTVQELSRGKFDRGRILGQEKVVVPPNSGFLELEPILAKAGGELLTTILRDLAKRQELARPQDGSLATLAPKLTKLTTRIDWTRHSNVDLTRLQRGAGHQYPLWTTLAQDSPGPVPPIASAPPQPQLQLVLSTSGPQSIPRSALAPSSASASPLPPPGAIFLSPRDKSIYVACAPASSPSSSSPESEAPGDEIEVVQVDKVKKEGGKWIQAREWWNGASRAGPSSASSQGWIQLE
ncbi:hypothetical protein JCM11491_002954 [Sporobolomyces phaffii]